MRKNMDPWRDECIDPGLGRQVWRLDDPQVEPALRGRLEAHVTYCAACRLDRAMQRTVAEGLAGGALALRPVARGRRTWWRLSGATSLAAVAASLLLVFLLPPRTASERQVMRAEGTAPAILRPAADEVIAGRHPELRWTPLGSASAYRVSVQDADGRYAWTGETSEARLRIPADRPLPAGARLRVFVEPVPAYLAPPGGLRSAFRTGTFPEFVAFRVAVAPKAVQALGVAGMLGCLALVGWAAAGRRQTD